MSFQVILSVPQYKSTAASSVSSAASADSVSSSDLSHNSLTVTPVLKLDLPDQEDPADDEAEEEEEEGEEEEEDEEELEDAKQSSYALDNILGNQTQSFFSLEQFKQASLIFQKHTTMNGNGLKGSSEFLQHSIWNNLVSSTVPASDSSNDEKRKVLTIIPDVWGGNFRSINGVKDCQNIGQVMNPHHFDQMSQKSVYLCSLCMLHELGYFCVE